MAIYISREEPQTCNSCKLSLVHSLITKILMVFNIDNICILFIFLRALQIKWVFAFDAFAGTEDCTGEVRLFAAAN